MSDSDTLALISMVDKLASHAALSASDRTALLDLPFSLRVFEPGSYLVREGDVSDRCAVLVAGFVYRHKITGEGARQIVSIHIPGEIIDLQRLFLDVADHNVQTLTRCKVATVSRSNLRALVAERESIGTGLFISALVEASIHREWILNIGRRDARTRIAHLLCEFAVRLDVQGLTSGQPYELPMTQEQLGDALELTAVHVNRTLRGLINEGLVTYNKRGITFPNWEALKVEADFNSRYLHLDHTRIITG